jgi:hypothetical protein
LNWVEKIFIPKFRLLNPRTLKNVILYLIGFALLASPAFAQVDDEEDSYQSEFAYGVNLNTNAGLIGGLLLKNSRKITNNMYHYFYLEVVNVKHAKEYRQTNPYTGNLFTLGKQNYLFVFRPQYGREFVLFRKAPEEGVQINGILAAGPSIGVVKPYYIQYQFTSNDIRSVPYDPRIHTSIDRILGSGSFFEGFDQAKFRIGASIKAAASFELGTFRNSVTGFEVGLLAEIFSQNVPIMAPSFANNQNIFTSGYVNIFFGSRR